MRAINLSFPTSKCSRDKSACHKSGESDKFFRRVFGCRSYSEAELKSVVARVERDGATLRFQQKGWRVGGNSKLRFEDFFPISLQLAEIAKMDPTF